MVKTLFSYLSGIIGANQVLNAGSGIISRITTRQSFHKDLKSVVIYQFKNNVLYFSNALDTTKFEKKNEKTKSIISIPFIINNSLLFINNIHANSYISNLYNYT